MPIEEIINSNSNENNKVVESAEKNDYINDLRPKILKEYVGQDDVCLLYTSDAADE